MDRRKRTRVLVVHDWDADREAFAETLESAGYSASTAASFHDALRELALAPPDVIVVDLAIPESGAASLLTHMRRSPALRAIRTVLVTGIGASLTRRLFAADAILEKPVTGRTLLAALLQLEGADGHARGA